MGQGSEISDKHRDAIDEIMDNFEFEKVHKAMAVLGWKWHSVDDGPRVPTVKELRAGARRLLRDCCADPERAGMATGGFRVEKSPNELRLVFELADWDVELEDDCDNAPSDEL